jgi:DNA-binding XRE family transcriptional regulator
MSRSTEFATLSGKKVLQLRLQHKISQECLADEINRDRRVIIEIEADRSKEVTLCTAYKLAQYFNVTIESLIK